MSELPAAKQPDPLLMPREAAAMLGISPAVLNGLQRAGSRALPPCICIGWKLRYRKSDIEAMLANGAVTADNLAPGMGSWP